jgi:hypothetical protein
LHKRGYYGQCSKKEHPVLHHAAALLECINHCAEHVDAYNFADLGILCSAQVARYVLVREK